MISEIALYRDRSNYTFGYTFGYLSEQAVTGALTAIASTVGKIVAKNGTSMLARLTPRAMAVVALRMHYIKEGLRDFALIDDTLRPAYEGVMSSMARHPTSPNIKEIPASLMENRLKDGTFTRTTFNFKEWVKTATKNGNVRKLIASPAGRDIFAKRTSQLMHLLGDQCDATTMKNFMKVADERVVIVHPDGAVDEYFEGFFRAFEGNPGIMHQLDDPAGAIPNYSPEAKARLKQFLSDPDAGNLWKIDDPIWGPNGEPDIPHNYWTRGIIAELDLYYRSYKRAGFSHLPTQPGFDYQGAAGALVQAKSVKNPDGAVNAMQKAIFALAEKDPTNTLPLTLHVMTKPGTDSAALQTALEVYKVEQGLLGRLDIIIRPYNIGPQ